MEFHSQFCCIFVAVCSCGIETEIKLSKSAWELEVLYLGVVVYGLRKLWCISIQSGIYYYLYYHVEFVEKNFIL